MYLACNKNLLRKCRFQITRWNVKIILAYHGHSGSYIILSRCFSWKSETRTTRLLPFPLSVSIFFEKAFMSLLPALFLVVVFRGELNLCKFGAGLYMQRFLNNVIKFQCSKIIRKTSGV